MTCRWCNHETILTEDASPLLSALAGAALLAIGLWRRWRG